MIINGAEIDVSDFEKEEIDGEMYWARKAHKKVFYFNEIHQICSYCTKSKKYKEFYKDTTMLNCKARCKKCFRKNSSDNTEYNKKWREDNKEYLKEYSKRYSKENKERLKKYNKKWREDNKKHPQKWKKENKGRDKKYRKRHYNNSKNIARYSDIREEIERYKNSIKNCYNKIRDHRLRAIEEYQEALIHINLNKVEEIKEEEEFLFRYQHFFDLKYDYKKYKDRSGIYIFTFPNNKIYIGQTTQTIKKRWAGHLSSAKSEEKGTPVIKAIRKYGWENVKREIIYIGDNSLELLGLEQVFIKKYNSSIKTGFGYNVIIK